MVRRPALLSYSLPETAGHICSIVLDRWSMQMELQEGHLNLLHEVVSLAHSAQVHDALQFGTLRLVHGDQLRTSELTVNGQ